MYNLLILGLGCRMSFSKYPFCFSVFSLSSFVHMQLGSFGSWGVKQPINILEEWNLLSRCVVS